LSFSGTKSNRKPHANKFSIFTGSSRDADAGGVMHGIRDPAAMPARADFANARAPSSLISLSGNRGNARRSAERRR